MNHFVTFVVLVLDRLITTIQMMVNQISLLNNSGERGLWGWPSFFYALSAVSKRFLFRKNIVTPDMAGLPSLQEKQGGINV